MTQGRGKSQEDMHEDMAHTCKTDVRKEEDMHGTYMQDVRKSLATQASKSRRRCTTCKVPCTDSTHMRRRLRGEGFEFVKITVNEQQLKCFAVMSTV